MERRALERAGYVTQRSLLSSLKIVLKLKRSLSTVEVLREMEVTKKELQDTQLGLITTLEWVRLSTRVQKVSQACELLLRRWEEVLGWIQGRGVRGGPVASVFSCFLCLFWNILHHLTSFPFKRH